MKGEVGNSSEPSDGHPKAATAGRDEMSEIRSFGEIDGTPVEEIVLRSPGGATASIVTIGAAIRDLRVPVGGAMRRVVLGYETVEGYRDNPAHLGVMVGRCANRIGGGRFRLDGREHRLAVNEAGRTTLHGGPRGFGKRIWRITEAEADTVELALTSEDGDQGFPGRVEVRCRYRLTEAATLEITASATTDAPTPMNLTNHAYFTLSEGGDCREHRLAIAAEHYTPVDATLVPTGVVAPVAGTPFDFRTARRITEDYDVPFVLDGAPGEMIAAARVVSPDGRSALEVLTDQPCLQLYTAPHLGPSDLALAGQSHGRNAGFCLEAQGLVDAPNKRHFASVTLRPGEVYRHATTYRFVVDPA